MPRNSTQHVCLNVVAAAALLCGFAGPSQGAEKQLVLLYNTAQIPPGVIAEAKATAAEVLREAGVELQWMNCSAESTSCSAYLDERPLILQLLGSSESFPDRRSLGYGAAGSNGGTYAFVFFDRVKRVFDSLKRMMALEQPPCSLSQMLGHVMAHEMGHLLLSQVGHSSKGIMTGAWGVKELQQAGRRELLFTFNEAARMRKEVKRRAAAVAAEMARRIG